MAPVIQWLMGYKIDYTVYYIISKDAMINGFNRTYDEIYWNMITPTGPYRYLPAFLYALYPLTMMSLQLSYSIFFIINMIASIISYYYIEKCCAMLKIDFASSKKYEMMMEIIFLIVLTSEVTISGQVVLLLMLCLILSFYQFLKGNQFIASILIGVSIFIKPIYIILAILMIIYPGKKGMIKRLLGIAIPLIPNALIFFFDIPLLQDFIKLNISTVDYHASYRFNSISFMNIFAIMNVPKIMLFIQIAMIAICIVFPILITRKESSQGSIGTFSIFVFYQDVWSNQVLPVYCFVIPLIIKYKNQLVKKLLLINLILNDVRGNFFNLLLFIGMINRNIQNVPWVLVGNTMSIDILIELTILTLIINSVTILTYASLPLKIRKEVTEYPSLNQVE
jgi:hypothetical protein